MANYNFTDCLSPLDFELLSKDLLEAELGIHLENFREGRDKGIDLRYAPLRAPQEVELARMLSRNSPTPPELIVQCKRYSSFNSLKSALKNEELEKIKKLNPARYILTTSVSLSPPQVDELKTLLSPFVQTTGDIYGRERLNSILTKHSQVERTHIKLWVNSAGILDSIVHAGTHAVSSDEVKRTIAAAKIYVRNTSFDEALSILKNCRVCIISGLPGIGKTTLARMLLLYFYERGFDVIKIESDISEARAVTYHKKPRFYYYDDFLGQTAQADKLNKNEDQKLLDFMSSIQDSKDSVFVLTTREYILNQAQLNYEKLAREKFKYRTCIIDLSKYTRRIRAQILYNHLHFSNLPRTHLESLVAKRGYIPIVDHKNYNPRLIQYLTDLAWLGETSSADYLQLFLKNLNNPVEIWGHAFRNQLSDRARHLLLVLTTMPLEALLPDVEEAFVAYHSVQCGKFNITRSPTDFKNALKELDGTFIATRKIDSFVLIRFQNPSIRDFMQNLLLDGEQLPEVLGSLVFFEQAQWFWETLNNSQPQVSLENLSLQSTKIVESLQRLINSKSCTFFITGEQPTQRIWQEAAKPVHRFAKVAVAITKQSASNARKWIEATIWEFADRIEEGTLSPSAFDHPLQDMKEHGWLSSESGNRLVTALTRSALTEPDDLDEFETLANLVRLLPQSFTELELETVRESFSEFAERFVSGYDARSPDDTRDDASRLDNIGSLLKVDTDDHQTTLREFADEFEKEQERHWEDDDYRGGNSGADVCSDGELDSMFGTLGGQN